MSSVDSCSILYNVLLPLTKYQVLILVVWKEVLCFLQRREGNLIHQGYFCLKGMSKGGIYVYNHASLFGKCSEKYIRQVHYWVNKNSVWTYSDLIVPSTHTCAITEIIHDYLKHQYMAHAYIKSDDLSCAVQLLDVSMPKKLIMGECTAFKPRILGLSP